jgi:hypothetical protein
MRALPCLVLLLVATGCSVQRVRSSNSATVTQRTMLPTSVLMEIDGEPAREARVSTDGEDTVIRFDGRTIVLRGLTGYTGRVGTDGIDLDVAGIAVTVNRTMARAGGRRYAFADLPRRDAVLLFADGRFDVR